MIGGPVKAVKTENDVTGLAIFTGAIDVVVKLLLFVISKNNRYSPGKFFTVVGFLQPLKNRRIVRRLNNDGIDRQGAGRKVL